MMRRSDDETWLLNPKRRYILNADTIDDLAPHIETMSDLEGSAFYKPLRSAPKVRLPGSSILVERYRDRGIGDLLFTTGPMAYLHHITGGDLKIHYYTYGERGSILNQCPYLVDGSPLVGPIYYDELPHYDYHWFVDTVTEYNEELEQPNVYDSLYASLGIDPSTVDARFKRPFARLTDYESGKILDDFFYWVFQNTKLHLDLRHTGYYVVAPFSNSSIRSTSYQTILNVLQTLAERRPVLLVGAIRDRMPVTDMAVGDFVNIVEQNLVSAGRVVNMLGRTQLRNLMQLISKASCVLSMDSASLYIAQSFRTPCVSLWGSHHPGVRLGYDPEYMDLAVWEQKACRNSPCFAWQGFPANRCPQGAGQTVCQCQLAVSHEEIVRRFDAVESRKPKLIKIPTAK
jgi:hypothetical protein